MVSDVLNRALEVLSGLHSADPEVQRAVKLVGDAISVGNITGSTGVAIGRDIRMVVNHFNLSADEVARLLEGRAALVGIDPEQYKLRTLLADRTRDFVGREYAFREIDRFLNARSSGYLLIEGEPGLGKSSILAEYVRRTGCTAHFNTRGQGIVRASQFLESVCSQLIVDYGLPYTGLPAKATEDGTFLEKLLQEACKRLQTRERLVIAVDALDEVDLAAQAVCANILCLPTTLPIGVYFIMTKRKRVKIPLVAQAPQVLLDLMQFPAENRNDVERYLIRSAERPKVQVWVARQKTPTIEAFIKDLADLSECNFMYLRYVLPEIEEGIYQNLSIEKLPTGLEGYYDDHWQRMGMKTDPLPELKIVIVYILSEVREPVSLSLIHEILTHNKYDANPIKVQGVLSEWGQFLDEQPAPNGKRYSLYHASFRDFLNRQDIVQAAGVTIKRINEVIADYLWAGLYDDEGGKPDQGDSIANRK